MKHQRCSVVLGDEQVERVEALRTRGVAPASVSAVVRAAIAIGLDALERDAPPTLRAEAPAL